MELKLYTAAVWIEINRLLIVPYGIEIIYECGET